ncbi:thiol-disulfide isomerase, partial [Candidatus Woesearchaeota archaeon]|nr:thiol-disulfide isomerase [Candidatus Woesearchaeota archaeon]
VALDNDYKTWRAYRNAYWPRKYLLDVDGYIRYDHIGEGGYEETEREIQKLLKERAGRLKSRASINESVSSPEGAIPVSFYQVRSPELYFGYKFIRQPLGNSEGYAPEKEINYSLPGELSRLEQNKAYLEGAWRSNSDNMELVSSEGKIALKYDARAVNIVAGADKSATVEILVDGKPLNRSNAGLDVNGTNAIVSEFRMYNVVLGDYGKHELLLKIKGRGFRIYTFTFG